MAEVTSQLQLILSQMCYLITIPMLLSITMQFSSRLPQDILPPEAKNKTASTSLPALPWPISFTEADWGDG